MPFKINPTLYSIWKTMKQRCYNPNCKAFSDYGGRGITVCQRWQIYKNFELDMLPSYKKGLTLDRIENDSNYEPSNCRWATRKDQQRNRRTTIIVEIEGVKYKAVELAELCGVKCDTIVSRAKRGLPYSSVVSRNRQLNPNSSDHIKAAVAARIAKQKAATHCKNGHAITPKNTAVTPEGWRRCRVCHREREMKRRSQS